MDAAGDVGEKVMWRPDYNKRTNILDFRQKVNRKYCLDLGMSENRSVFQCVHVYRMS
jgi:hypothetical protein